jgi:hypothetical protein
MIPTIPQGLGPLLALRSLRDFADQLPKQISRSEILEEREDSKPSKVQDDFQREKHNAVAPQQIASNESQFRAEDLGQRAPTPPGLKPLNKLSETDVAQIRDAQDELQEAQQKPTINQAFALQFLSQPFSSKLGNNGQPIESEARVDPTPKLSPEQMFGPSAASQALASAIEKSQAEAPESPVKNPIKPQVTPPPPRELPVPARKSSEPLEPPAGIQPRPVERTNIESPSNETSIDTPPVSQERISSTYGIATGAEGAGKSPDPFTRLSRVSVTA